MSLLDAAGVVTGDIWCNAAFSFDSPLKDLLDSGEYTLEQLLAEDELLQELRGLHPQLIEFFSTEAAVAGLVRYVILPPQPEEHVKGQQQAEDDNDDDKDASAVDPVAGESSGVKAPMGEPIVAGEQEEAVSGENENSGEDIQGNATDVVSGDNDETTSKEMTDSSPPPTPPPSLELTSTLEGTEATTTEDTNSDVDATTVPTHDEGQEVLHEEPEKEGSEMIAHDDEDDDYAPHLPPTEPTELEKENTTHIRYPYMACEVICCEMKSIIDILVDGYVPAGFDFGSNNKNTGSPTITSSAEDSDDGQEVKPMLILDLLFSMLYDAGPGEIDDYRAGYFDKILSILFQKRPQAMSDYINEGGGKGNISLMSVMFRHLYSHSIMQIVQRLLLPQPDLLPPVDEEGGGAGENGNPEDAQDEFNDPQQVLGGDIDLDGLGSFRCNWTENPASLDMLLDCLIESNSPDDGDLDEERQLSLHQNASEVLITIIQNSPLTSPVLHSMTTDPVLERLVLAATRLDENTNFCRHDSRLTCAMNVLESLILQLGGYGSIGAMIYPDGENDEGGNPTVLLEDTQTAEERHEDESNPSSTGAHESAEINYENNDNLYAVQPTYDVTRGQEDPDYATADTLIQHLPAMLSSLSSLLLDKTTEGWLSQMQYASSPQKILGSSRLRIVRLLESLVLLGDPVVDAHLVDSDSLEICLDLFWEFQWCSMLHQSVANLLVHVFEGQNTRSELQSYFIVKCNLLARLIDSFWDSTDNMLGMGDGDGPTAELTEDVVALKDIGDNKAASSSLASEKGSTSGEFLSVSDDDVDVAMEQQSSSSDNAQRPMSVSDSNREAEDTAENRVHDHDHAPAQSFRLGYMGHVIIICQALVHACTNDGKSEAQSFSMGGGGTINEAKGGDLENFVETMNGAESDPSAQQEDNHLRSDAFDRGRAGESVTTDETAGSTPLVIMQLVDSHPLSNKWQEFVSSTLASETAIQSTPLGGYQGPTPGMDPLHAHRPGAEEDEYDNDDGAAQPLPPGLMVGGEALDMDDNDLDIAASMMAGMSLGRAPGTDNPTEQDLLESIPRDSHASSGTGYMFDDPLGAGRFGDFDDDKGDSSSSSSDEESEVSGNTGDSGSAVADGFPQEAPVAEKEAPVLDLFAGNNLPFGEQSSTEPANTSSGWSADFANFDANFDDAFGEVAATNGHGSKDDSPNSNDSADNSNFDNIFGEARDHAALLEELDNPPSVVSETQAQSKLTDQEALDSIPLEN